MRERDRLITENIGYVVTLARQYKSDILSPEDLVSEGTIGLTKAADKFDPSRGKPFVTFAAPYIRRSIETAISRLETTTDVRSTDESLPEAVATTTPCSTCLKTRMPLKPTWWWKKKPSLRTYSAIVAC